MTAPEAEETQAGESPIAETQVEETATTETPSVKKDDNPGLSTAAQEALKRAASTYGEVRDRFAEWMTGATRDSDRRLADYMEKSAERRKEAVERLEKAEEKSVPTFRKDREGNGLPELGSVGRDADTESKVGAYAAANKPAVVVLQDKVV
jgi:hypothetical protein